MAAKPETAIHLYLPKGEGTVRFGGLEAVAFKGSARFQRPGFGILPERT
jgi:hypothetical protein